MEPGPAGPTTTPGGPIVPPGGPILPPGGPILPPGAAANATANATAGPGPMPLPGGPLGPLPGGPLGPLGPEPAGPILTPPGMPETGPKPAGAANGTMEQGPSNSANATGSSTGSASGSGQMVGALSEFEQCGGAGGNCHSMGEGACADAIFAGKGCKEGYECVRQSFFYRQCLKPDVIKSLGSAWVTAGPAPRADCPKGFVGFQQQCGGSGGSCKEDAKLSGECKDAAAPGVCCEPGTTCQRQNEWFWQCQGQPTNSAASD